MYETKHVKTEKYHRFEYTRDGVRRAVLLPHDAPKDLVEFYLNKLTQAKQPAPVSGCIDAAVA